MTISGKITFGPFRLDTIDETLRRGTVKIHLRPKTYALLLYLATQSGRLITKDELMNSIWADCNVGEEALKHCVKEIRRALNDSASAPQFIETVHRRGYRFIGRSGRTRKRKTARPLPGKPAGTDSTPGSTPFVGRLPELAHLKNLYRQASRGARQTALVSGEQGIGKTSLVDAFLETITSLNTDERGENKTGQPLVARGQCIQAHGTSEAYMPVLEALTELCRGSERRQIINTLCRYAPLWMVQMPSQLSTDQLLRLQMTTRNATRERMMRELAEAFEELSSDKPLILILEDLHWSDPSTLDWLLYWVQRRKTARLYIITTYRPAEITEKDHPFNSVLRELQVQQACRTLSIPSLDETDVWEYLARRFPSHRFPSETTHWIRQRTGGNPLFMANLLNHIIEQGLLLKQKGGWVLKTTLEDLEQVVPPTIRQIVDWHIERCTSDEQRLLQAAGVKGLEFSVAGVSEVLQETENTVEQLCRGLAQRGQFLQQVPHRIEKGKRLACYSFIHILYRNICYQLIPSERKALFHRRVAAYLEQTDDRQAEELYAQIAMHYSRGREYRRAVRYYLKAVDNANKRYAGHEAKELATLGIRLLEMLPSSSERIESEIRLQNALGTALMSIDGLGADSAKKAFTRAQDLFQKLSPSRKTKRKSLIFNSLYGLWTHHWVHADFGTARQLAERLVRLAKLSRDPFFRSQSHYSLGIILMDQGQFNRAIEHLQEGSGIICRCFTEITRWHVGYPDTALQRIENILAYALETGNAENVISAYIGTARVNMARGDYEKTMERAMAAMENAINQRQAEPWLIPMRIYYGWGVAKTGKRRQGIRLMKRALDSFRDIKAFNLKPLFSTLYADILLDAGQIDEGLSVVEEALSVSENTGVHHCDTELIRLKGELQLLAFRKSQFLSESGKQNIREAEACFLQAETIARRQGAKSLELRAVTSLARLWMEQDRIQEARKRLMKIYNWFTEGQDTADLRRARELLENTG